MTDLPESERERYEQQLEELSEKQILLEIMTELKTIRWQNQQALSPQTESESETYDCLRCGNSIPEGNLEDHAQTHGWHSGMELDLIYDL